MEIKKLIIILFFWSFALSGQNKATWRGNFIEIKPLYLAPLSPITQSTSNWKIDFNETDKQQHLFYGYAIGFVVNISTYFVFKDTKLKPWWSKLIGLGSGIIASLVLSDLKERYDANHGGFYNKKDRNASIIGGAGGSFTVRFALWGAISESKIPEDDIFWLINEPLVKR